ncbi:MAG: hypothetical protein ACTSR0_04285 [Candidatus Asgardarchaeia archaeon]
MSKNLSLTETCKFKLEPTEEQIYILEELFTAYTEIVKTCFNFTIKNNVTSRRKLHNFIYRKLRNKFPEITYKTSSTPGWLCLSCPFPGSSMTIPKVNLSAFVTFGVLVHFMLPSQKPEFQRLLDE